MSNIEKKNATFNDVLSKVAESALIPNIAPYTSTITTKDEVMQVTKMVVPLVNGKKGKTELSINSPVIAKAVTMYNQAMELDNMAMYVKCKALSNLAKDMKTIKDMGYDTIGDFAWAVWGLKKGTANQYARIGHCFLDDNCLPIAELPQGIKVSALIECLSYVCNSNGDYIEGTFTALYGKGILVDGMSPLRIREALKEHYKPQLSEGKQDKDKDKDKGKDKDKDKDEDKDEKFPDQQLKDASVKFVDALKESSPIERASAMLACLDTIDAIVKASRLPENYPAEQTLQMVDALRNVARVIAG